MYARPLHYGREVIIPCLTALPMDAALSALFIASCTFNSVTARIAWLSAVFWMMVATFEAMFVALGTTMFPLPFCTMTARRLPALGILITGLPGVTAEPLTNTVGETEPAVDEEFEVACEPGMVCPRPDAPLLFGAAFSVVFRPAVCAGAPDDVGDAVTTGVAAGVEPCAALGAGAADGLAPGDEEEDRGVADAP
jgi:hypothetical protein